MMAETIDGSSGGTLPDNALGTILRSKKWLKLTRTFGAGPSKAHSLVCRQLANDPIALVDYEVGQSFSRDIDSEPIIVPDIIHDDKTCRGKLLSRQFDCEFPPGRHL